MPTPTAIYDNERGQPSDDQCPSGGNRAGYRGVTGPDADTLHSLGWLDLAEPQVFNCPDMGKRFYAMRDFAVLSERGEAHEQ
jgi:Protein of unknown function (DUF1254)